MYAAERRRQILEMIRSEASVKVTELAQLFEVSPSTIRRDLNELHKAELLERTYGGAVTSPLNEYEAPFSERSVSHRDEKDRIGQAAAGLVKPGEMIIVDGGTTTECMARYLREIAEVTVVTFGANIVNALAGAELVTVIGIGGVLQHRTLIFGGVLALDALEVYNMRFDKAFLAATGISAEDGITNFGFEEIPLKRKAIEYARGGDPAGRFVEGRHAGDRFHRAGWPDSPADHGCRRAFRADRGIAKYGSDCGSGLDSPYGETCRQTAAAARPLGSRRP